jgi:hypothetical protein
MRKCRYQKGSVKKQRGRWVAMWWVDGGRKSRVLGLVKDMTKSDARAAVDRIVTEVNAKRERNRVWRFWRVRDRGVLSVLQPEVERIDEG